MADHKTVLRGYGSRSAGILNRVLAGAKAQAVHMDLLHWVCNGACWRDCQKSWNGRCCAWPRCELDNARISKTIRCCADGCIQSSHIILTLPTAGHSWEKLYTHHKGTEERRPSAHYLGHL